MAPVLPQLLLLPLLLPVLLSCYDRSGHQPERAAFELLLRASSRSRPVQRIQEGLARLRPGSLAQQQPAAAAGGGAAAAAALSQQAAAAAAAAVVPALPVLLRWELLPQQRD